jgi:hypothetical protein
MQLARRTLLCAAVLVVLVGGGQPAAVAQPGPAATTPQRYRLAAYQWHSADQLTAGQARQRLRFLRQHGIRTVYLDLGDYLDVADQPHSQQRQDRLAQLRSRLRRYVAAASSFGVAVHAVGGGPTWTDEPRRYLGSKLVELVADYNADAEVRQRLQGVQLDIEPHADPRFFVDVAAALDAYLETVARIVRTYRRQAARSVNRRLQLGLAIPFWFDAGAGSPGPVSFRGRTKPAAHHVVDLVKDLPRAYLVVMSYRNVATGGDGSIFHARNELAYARSVGARAGLLVGQQFTNVQPAKLTFYGRGRRAFQKAAAQIVRAYGHFPQFRGLSIDDLDAYMAER